MLFSGKIAKLLCFPLCICLDYIDSSYQVLDFDQFGVLCLGLSRVNLNAYVLVLCLLGWVIILFSLAIVWGRALTCIIFHLFPLRTVPFSL